jgi:starch synthase
MKILFAANEAVPFSLSDGTGYIAGGLPTALARRRGVEVAVILPLYSDMPEDLRAQLRFVAHYTVPLSWRRQYCGLYELRRNDVTWYFLDNEYYFKRYGLYGFYDDGERFAFFCRAVLETLEQIPFTPDILHCGNWQTALIPVYLQLFYRRREKFAKLPCVFSIHNIRNQCVYGLDILDNTYGIPPGLAHPLEYAGTVNLMKGAVETSSLVMVTPTAYGAYLLENPAGCHGLHGFLYRQCLRGVPAGIDISRFSPLADPSIATNYGLDDWKEGKEACKADLRADLGLAAGSMPLAGFVTRYYGDAGEDLLFETAETLLRQGLQLALVGLCPGYEERLNALFTRWPGRVGMRLGFDEAAARKIYAGADLFLTLGPAEAAGFEHLAALRYGAVPVAWDALRDTVRDDPDRGNGFLFRRRTPEALAGATARAKALFGKPEWDALARRAMQCDNSWTAAAPHYINAYQRVLKNR